MTRAVAIDFGTSRTKLAYLNGDRPELMRFSHDRAFAPSLFYLEPGNESIIWGDEAEDMLGDDPAGIVDVLKRRLRQRKIRASRRSEAPERLLYVMFSELRQQAARELPSLNGVAPDAVRLTAPALFGPAEEDLLRKTALEAGFEEVAIIPEPVAAARHWLSEAQRTADHVIVLDCGGGTVDWAYLTKRDGELRLMPQCPPGGLDDLGGYDVDLALLEILRGRLADDVDATKELSERQPHYIARLRALKEDVSRGKLPRPVRVASKSVEFSSAEVLGAMQSRFTDRVLGAFAEYARRVETLAGERPPVLLVGGSAQVSGLDKRLQDLGCRVERWDRSEFATVLEAAVAGEAPAEDLTEVEFDLLLEWAEEGRADAQAELGERYASGRGGATKDDLLSHQWNKLAADQGHVYGIVNLAADYYYGSGVQRDLDTAFRLVRQAASQNLPDALAFLGMIYAEGEACRKDKYEANRLMRLSVDRGSILGKLILGVALGEEGKLENNPRQAVTLLKEVLEDKNPRCEGLRTSAAFLLGVWYKSGSGVDADPDEALKWFRKAANAGEAKAQIELGDFYFTGEHITKNLAEAFRWYLKAALQGDAIAQLIIGNCYKDGSGVREDRAQAIAWYTRSAEQGNTEAQFGLGCLYRYGNGVVQDWPRAILYLKEAAEQHHGEAQNMLGYLYHKGEGVTRNWQMALQWWHRAANSGSVQGMWNLASCYAYADQVGIDQEKAVHWFRKAMDADHEKDLFDVLDYALLKKDRARAEIATIELVKKKSGHGNVRSAEAAASIPSDLLRVLSFLWARHCGKLSEQPFVSRDGAFTTTTGFWSSTTWFQSRMKEVGLE